MPIQRAKPRFTEVKNVSNITANQLDIGQIGGRRNIAINGAMQVAQRATSVSSISSGDTYQTVDRFMTRVGTAGTWTQTQETLAVTDPPFVQHGHTKALKMDCTTANGSLSAGSYIIINYRIEGQDMQQLRTGTSNPAPMTISFWVKATKTGTNVLTTYQDEGGKQVSLAYTINSSNTWEHKTLVVPGNSHDAIANDNTRGRQISWNLALGSNRTSGSLQSTWQTYATGDEGPGQVNHADNTANNFHLTGVQMEVGSVATPFEHASSFGEELALCQRYYYHTYSYGTSAGTTFDVDYAAPIIIIGTGNYGMGVCNGVYPVEMRAAPTVSFYSSTGTANRIRYWGGAGGDLTYGTVNRSTRQILGMSLGAGSNPEDFYSAALVCDAEL